MDVFSLDKEYIANTYARFPIEITGGKGSLVYDGAGREYIDLGTGIAVNIFGVCDDGWTDAVKEQLHKFQHTSNLFYSEPCVKLAQLLCERTGMKRVFFGNSGAEANECAIKAARKYQAENKGAEYYNIITMKNSFHGRTITTLAATGQDVFHSDFLPLTDGFLYAEANNLQSVEKLLSENKCAAVMFETVQGEGGVIPLDESFVKGLSCLAEKYDVLLIDDEVQTGNGRTGELYGYMNYGVTPDIVTTAKGIGGGLPIGVCMLGNKCKDVFTPGSHGSTFGGNPVCCAGAYNILSRIDDELLSSVREKSALAVKMLSGAKGIKSVTGAGLMLGIETEKPASDLVAACRERGVLVLTAKTKLRLLPALNIPDELFVKALEIIKDVCAED